MKKYIGHYTSKDFIKNASFLRWKLFESPEDKLFWNECLQENPEITEQIEEAEQIIRTIVRLNDYALTEEESLLISQAIQDRLQQQLRKKKIIYWCSSVAAACIIFLFILSSPVAKEKKVEEPLLIAESSIEGGNEENKGIRIIINDKECLYFDQNTDIRYDKGGKIVVLNEDKEVTKIDTKDRPIQKNKLIVPKGKRSSLVLTDGTKIWINSGSTLEFPHYFEKDKREIMVEGEIYIEVAKEEERPFFVNTPDVSVKVLGTRFNISAYKDDLFSNVVLVEGKVEVSYENEKIILNPNQLAILEEKHMKVKTADVYDYISWKDGLLQFNSKPLPQILTRLSRYYDVDISCGEDIQDLSCTGKLVLFDDFSQVLKTIANTVPIKYEIINDHKILISKK